MIEYGKNNKGVTGVFKKTLDPHLNAILSNVDFNKPVEEQAKTVEMASEAFFKADVDIPKDEKDATMSRLAIHLRFNYPNLAHHVHYLFNDGKINTSIYESEELARLMSLKSNFPQYQTTVLHDIKSAIGYLPNKEPDFAHKEMALRVTLKSLFENGTYNEFYWYDYIRTIFNKKKDFLNEHEKIRKEAEKIYAEYKATWDKSKSKKDKFREGYEFGKFLTGHDRRKGLLTSYVANIDKEKENQYGSDELNYFMHQPMTFPEYGSIIRRYIKDEKEHVPWGDKCYPYIELAMRYIYAVRVEKNLTSDTYMFHMLRELLEDACEKQCEKADILN